MGLSCFQLGGQNSVSGHRDSERSQGSFLRTDHLLSFLCFRYQHLAICAVTNAPSLRLTLILPDFSVARTLHLIYTLHREPSRGRECEVSDNSFDTLNGLDERPNYSQPPALLQLCEQEGNRTYCS